MSFKKNKEYTNWIKENKHKLNECGIPENIYKNEKRWYSFLDHGFDEYAYSKNDANIFSFNCLNQEQKYKFIKFLNTNYPGEYQSLIKDGM